VATLAHGSGFLTVYLAGLVLGNGPLPYRSGLLRVHDALAWLSQIGMFLIHRADVRPDGDPGGFWLGPTLLDHVPTTSRAYTEEIFGPVLCVVRVDSFDAGVALINAGEMGNGTAIFTNDGGAARRFGHEVEVGMIGVNVPIPVPVAYYSFGGWKQSLFGDATAYGPRAFDFFTRAKTVTSRWGDPATHGGVDLGFPRNDG
jgi:malonate-semialdehyde dehydrogenase (acetylating)/methylmalonate-semialdehyde dehydrogenase